MEYKRFSGPLFVGPDSETRMAKWMASHPHPLAGTRLSAEEVKRLTSGQPLTPTSKTAGRGAEIDRQRAEFRELLAKRQAPSLKAFSVYEITPQGVWRYGRMEYHTDDQVQRLAAVLGLESTPRLRWFAGVEEGVKSEPGWTPIMLALPEAYSPLGYYAADVREVWLKHGLTQRLEAKALAHELRHCWQWDTYGHEYMSQRRDWAEEDADRFAAEWAGREMRWINRYSR